LECDVALKSETAHGVPDGRQHRPSVCVEKAAPIIPNGVRPDRLRIAVGRDAKAADREVRANPEQAREGGQSMAPGSAGNHHKFPRFQQPQRQDWRYP
ncbi:MAG: hypothetical protein P8R45_01070, partial [Candidatus Binatia bacterium]|nr:hypothetical protein [Candidatus Binatia bacterium]